MFMPSRKHKVQPIHEAVQAVVKTLLTEDLDPSEEEVAARYFHGTPKEEKAKAIIRDGLLIGRDIQGRGLLAPRKDFVYLPRNIKQALPYVLGANMAGESLPSNIIKTDGRYGYLFVVKGADLVDIEPDEDSVGELFYKLLQKDSEGLTPQERRFVSFANQNLTAKQKQDAKWGEYTAWASGGKRLLKRMAREPGLMRFVMDNSSVVANRGAIAPSEGWRVDKGRSKELSKDGSNFFSVAKMVYRRKQ